MVYCGMANYHCTVKMISRTDGKSCVASLAYRSATKLEDRRTGDTWDYTDKGFVNHVEILLPKDAPPWIFDISEECKTSRQSALQKLSDVFEAAEARKDSQVYREVEFSLPTELTDEQNIKWANEFIRDVCCAKGMVAIMNFHFDIDKKTGEKKPHCHALLSTRNLTEDGFSKDKNREWNRQSLIHELREQCGAYQNAALKEHGFDVRVDHRSYEDRGIEIDPQPKLGKKISEMTKRGISREKQSEFDMVRLKNQFRIVKSPEIVFSIVTSNHSTFTEQDIAKVLNRYIDDADQFRILKDRLLGSKEIVPLVTQEGCESVYTTREMLRIEMSLVSRAEALSSGKTHRVDAEIIEEAIAHQNEKLSQYGGLSSDQEAAIRHMLSPDQISCVVGFAGAGKTTSLETAREGWEKAGYSVLGLAPTGKAARNIEGSGIRAMTLHKFLLAHQEGHERFSEKTVLVLDEAGMVDSRRMSELVSLMEKTGAKGVAMGDGHQLQAVEAGPAFRLLTDRIKPVVLETVVRQQVDWQREAALWFGEGHAAKALSLYQEKGVFTIIPEIQLKEGLSDPNKIVDNYCLARQVSGRIWKEMEADGRPPADEKAKPEASGALGAYKGKFPNYSHHPDYKLYQEWKGIRQAMVQKIIEGFDGYKVDGRLPVKGGLPDELAARGLDVASFASLAEKYRGGQLNCLNEIRTALRKMSYDNIVDTRVEAKEELVKAWWSDRQDSLHESHLILAFTNKDDNSLNESARGLVRAAGEIKGADYTIAAQRIDTDDFGEEVVTFHDRTFAQGDRILFTRNDNGLKVSNGTLGTILEINRQKMTVVLDGADQRTVSFSPNLYPYLDNGWATTIHKAQGVTVDHVKMLASFEQYRNLSYVGMTRHRYTLQVFGSDLDFWRKEKVVDRLSRVQEKLSVFDYLDADKIQEILAEDTAILWHEGKIGKARDLWSAVKVTAKEIYSQVAGSPQQPEGIAEEGYPSFDHTEEKRSTAFFKDGSADFSGEDSSPLKGDNDIREEKGTGMDPEGKKPDPKAKEGAAEESETFRQSNKPQSEKFREDFPQNPSREESASFKGDNGIQEEKGIASEGKEAASQADFPPVPGESQNQGLQKTGSLSGAFNGESEGKATKVGSQGLQGSSPPVTVRENFLSFAEVEDQLRERIVQLAEELLGKPTSRSGDKLRFGKRGSVSVFISGDKQGVYANFESGVKGGPLKLIEEQQGFSSSLEALKWGSQWLGGASFTVEQRAVEKPTSKPSAWKPVIPVPQSAENPEIKENKYLNYMLKDGAREVSRHAYRDEHGNLKGYVFRIEKADGSKITPPLSYCENEGGRQAWRWQGFEKDNKTPYGIEKLALDQTRPVLVVEGEKTADAAQKLFPEYHVLTWGGGAGNVDKTNWEPLVGRDVVIWPDNDQGGHKAAETLHNIIACANAGKGKDASVAIVPLPDEIPHKWDLADALPEGWTLNTIKEMAREAIPPKDITREVVQDGVKGSESPDSELQKGGIKAAEDRIARPIDADGLAHQEGHQTARSYSPQEQEILAYLSTEVAPKKHAWLKEQFADKVLEQAKADPFAALGKWQRVSRDFSFEPSIPDSQMTPQQKEVKDSILGYLHGHVHPDPKRWIRQGDCQDILEMADKKPGDALRAWQNLTRNYDFNPHLDKLSDRETVVYAYLKGKLSDKDARITKSMLESVTVHLLNDPLKAYGEWAQYSHDHTFDPKTGIPVIELKAQDYISALKDQVPQKTLKSWEGKLTQSPETVVQEACEFIKIQEEHEKFKEKLNNAVSRFISLSDIHEKLSPIDPKRHKIGEELRDMAKEHLKDKKFMEGIKDSHNDTAIKRLQEEVRIQHQLKHRELSRGMDMGM